MSTLAAVGLTSFGPVAAAAAARASSRDLVRASIQGVFTREGMRVGRWGVAEDATSWMGGVVVKVRSGDVDVAADAGMRFVGRARAAVVRFPRSMLVEFNLCW